MPHVRWIKNLCEHITTKKKDCNYPIEKIKNHGNNRGSNYEMERVENLYKELKLVGELYLENL